MFKIKLKQKWRMVTQYFKVLLKKIFVYKFMVYETNK